MRGRTCALAVLLLANVAHADPEETANTAAEEANLAANGPRSGLMLAAAIGAGITMGDGVGRGPAVSFRIGYLATPSTELTFELSGGSLLHAPEGGSTQHNDFLGLYAGAQHYLANTFWFRGSGGFVSYTQQPGTMVHGGVGALVGLGVDLIRWHYVVLDIETFGTVAAVSTRGGMFNSGLCLGISYY
ncbi:MAG: hypothetical protein QM831_25720 [Kofleriaceae bacterium]